MTKIGVNEEKKEKEVLTIPELVTVDLKPDIPDLQLRSPPPQRRRRHCTPTCCLAFFVVVFGLTSLLLAGMFFRHVRHMHRMYEMHDMVMVPTPHRMSSDHVEIDRIKETVFVERTEVDGSRGYSSLHNYKGGYAAHRDDHHKKCFIDKITKTFQEESMMWNTETHSRHHSAMRAECSPMSKQLLLYVAGQEVVKHCQEYPTYWLFPEKMDKHGPPMPRPQAQKEDKPQPRRIDIGGLRPGNMPEKNIEGKMME